MKARSLALLAILKQYSHLWVLLLPLLLFLPVLGAFPYPAADARFSDLTLAHYPYAEYLRESILIGRRLPLWSPLILSGSPFAANPLSGLWYAPGLAALLFPLPFGFNLLVMLHLLWGGLGMYKFLQSQGLGDQPALFGALGFEAMPKIYAHFGAGHLTLLYALTWTPWLLWSFQRRNLKTQSHIRSLSVSWDLLILALIFLADVRWSVYAAILWWGYALFSRQVNVDRDSMKDFLTRFLSLFIQTFFAALLAAPLALPLLEFTRLSTRLQMLPDDVLAFSLPAPRLLGLAFPDFHGFHEYMLYAGQGALLLALIVVIWRFRTPIVRFWLAMLIVSLCFALGANLSPIRALVALPLLDLLRVPSRALFLSGISILILAASAVQALLDHRLASHWPRVGLALAAFAGFQLALCAGVWLITGKLPLNFAWGAGFACLAVLWISLYLTARISVRLWFAGLLIICLVDWGGMDRTLFWPRPVEQALAEGQPLAQYLAAQEAQFRIYSPSYSLPQQTAVKYGLQLADGVDPLQLQSYFLFMQQATGVPWKGYSVTLPPFSSGEPAFDNAGYLPDPIKLGLLNVRYVASEYDLLVEGLELERQFGATRLYRNQRALPRAWVQPEDKPIGEAIQHVQLLEWQPERIAIRAVGPGLLVLSEVSYPGWRAWLDGQPAPVETVLGLLRGLSLGPGAHMVQFVFCPTSLFMGVGLCLVAIILLAIAFFRQRMRSNLT